MTTRDKPQTEQDLASPNQDPNRKAPERDPAASPKVGDTGSPGAEKDFNGAST